MPVVKTTLEGRYWDSSRLESVIDRILGKGNWKIKLLSGMATVFARRRLTEREIEEVRMSARMYPEMQRENDEIRRITMENESSHAVGHSSGLPSPPPKEADDTVSLMDKVPLYDQDGICVPLKSPNSPYFARLRLDNESTRTTGTYQNFEKLDDGETATVYGVRAEMMSSRKQPEYMPQARSKPIAIKCLKTTTSFSQFKAEFLALCRTESINHPNIVSYLGCFRKQESGLQALHFMFPQALGNMKRLFRGDYDRDGILQRSCDSLWKQYAGLASAMAYLHVSLNTAHRDIKPSNILIYQAESPKSSNEDLVLKITDFGLSLDLTHVPSFEYGSLALQSKMTYDPPELQKDRPISMHSTEQVKIPSPKELLSGDIWKLGCVFTELTAYLVRGGSEGVSEFRNHITTTEENVQSDYFNDTRFDDGERVKPEVLQWLEDTSNLDRRARRIEPLLRKMLASSADRPNAEDVFSSFLNIDFACLSYSDGTRIISLIEGKDIKPLRYLDQARLAIEDWIGQQVDWSPFPKIHKHCAPDKTLASWMLGDEELTLALSQVDAESLRAVCAPILWDRTTPGLPPPAVLRANNEERPDPNVPMQQLQRQGWNGSDDTAPQRGALLPSHHRSLRTSPSSWSRISLSLWLARMVKPSPPRPQEPEQPQTYREIFCCINRMYTEPLETVLQIIIRENLKDDEQFYEAVNKAIRDAAGPWLSGWLRRLFSWKTCMTIEFVEFKRMDNDQVRPLHSPRLPPREETQWTHGIAIPFHVNTKFLGEEMVYKLKSPERARGLLRVISQLPKKEGPPALGHAFGTKGWGIYASMGFSFWRFFWWLIIGELASVVFCIAWIWCKGDTQLTAAVIPGTLIISVLSLLNGMCQRLERPWKPSPDTPPSETLSTDEGASSAVDGSAEARRRR